VLDLVVANGVSNVSGEAFPSQLFFGVGDGSFADGTAAWGGSLAGADLYSVAAGDVDLDGDLDLYFGGQPTNVLLRNEGDRTFVDVSAASGAGGPPSDVRQVVDGRSKIVAIDDVDRDGRPDLVSASSTLADPGITVLRNDGNGAFTDVTAEIGAEIHPDGNPCAVMFTDYDNDGWRDLWIWNDRGGHTLLHNVDGVYEDLRNRADFVLIDNPMGIDAADIDHDGDLEYYVSNIGEHPLLRNNGDGTFDDVSEAWGTLGDYGWGLGFEDFDLDTFADLYVTQEDQRDTLVYQHQGTRYARLALDVRHPDDNAVAHNTPAAFGDVDDDGRVDVVWARTDGSPVGLHRNITDVGGRHWLDVRVEAAPETGERGGLGARVVVVTGDLVQFRDITGGSSRASQSALSARFGLGGWDGAEEVHVAWPDGRVLSYVNVPGDAALVVEETRR
jgi:enediyne biosynthesis protein E4